MVMPIYLSSTMISDVSPCIPAYLYNHIRLIVSKDSPLDDSKLAIVIGAKASKDDIGERSRSVDGW